jgi:MFS family permease
MAAIAVLVWLQCLGLRGGMGARDGAPADAAERSPDALAKSLRQALHRASRLPSLWAWLAAAAICTLLDELVVALAALRLQREQGLTESLAAAAAVSFSVGAVVGAALVERAVALHGSRRVLLVSGVLCAIALGALVFAPSALATVAALLLVGLCCAPHHSLALAQAYRVLPGSPGTVQALAQVFIVVDLVAPLALGIVADRFGLRAALACLWLQPVGIVVCALRSDARVVVDTNP